MFLCQFSFELYSLTFLFCVSCFIFAYIIAIQDAIDRESDEIEVTYNTPYGYPESIYIDPSTGAADDETSLTIGPLTASGSGGRIPGNGTDENSDSPTAAPTSASTMHAGHSSFTLGLWMAATLFGIYAM